MNVKILKCKVISTTVETETKSKWNHNYSQSWQLQLFVVITYLMFFNSVISILSRSHKDLRHNYDSVKHGCFHMWQKRASIHTQLEFRVMASSYILGSESPEILPTQWGEKDPHVWLPSSFLGQIWKHIRRTFKQR